MGRGLLFQHQLPWRGRFSRQAPKRSPTYAVLAILSDSYPPLKGRLPTCYSPVRHFTQGRSPFLVRLACVRPAANVRSEPGSNSPVNLKSRYNGSIYLAHFARRRSGPVRRLRFGALVVPGRLRSRRRGRPSNELLLLELGTRILSLLFAIQFSKTDCRSSSRPGSLLRGASMSTIFFSSCAPGRNR